MQETPNLHANVHPGAGMKKSRVNKSVVVAVVVTLISVAVLAGAFYGGYKMGEQRGLAAAKRQAPNPFAAMADGNRMQARYKIGQIVAVNNGSIQLKTNEQETRIAMNDKTKVTRKAEVLKLSDIKKGDQVTVFTNDDGTANRIVIKSQ